MDVMVAKEASEEEIFAYSAKVCGLSRGILIEVIMITNKNEKEVITPGFVRGQIKRSPVLNKPLYIKETGDKPVTKNIKKIYSIEGVTLFETNDAIYKVRFV